MNAQLNVDINSNKDKSLFIKAGPSIFGLNENFIPPEKIKIIKEKKTFKILKDVSSEQKMIYIMVTGWLNHWNNLKNNSTLFSKWMIKSPEISKKPVDGTTTIFIKKSSESQNLENCWQGKTYNFIEDSYKNKSAIRFNVKIEKEITCPEKYKNYSIGWYADKIEEDIINNTDYDPLFFKRLISTTDYIDFEKLVYILIKCIGIHTVHWFEPTNQAGKPDGFFKFNNLAILYDCTLNSSFLKNKNVQINNYCGQLKKDNIEYENKSIDVKNCKKNVWIITQSQKSKIIKYVDEIKVKEVSIFDLMKIYRLRLEKDFDCDELQRMLENIES